MVASGTAVDEAKLAANRAAAALLLQQRRAAQAAEQTAATAASGAGAGTATGTGTAETGAGSGASNGDSTKDAAGAAGEFSLSQRKRPLEGADGSEDGAAGASGTGGAGEDGAGGAGTGGFKRRAMSGAARPPRSGADSRDGDGDVDITASSSAPFGSVGADSSGAGGPPVTGSMMRPGRGERLATVRVTHLPAGRSVEDIRRLLEVYGRMVHFHMTHGATSCSVDYEDERTAAGVVARVDHMQLFGRGTQPVRAEVYRQRARFNKESFYMDLDGAGALVKGHTEEDSDKIAAIAQHMSASAGMGSSVSNPQRFEPSVFALAPGAGMDLSVPVVVCGGACVYSRNVMAMARQLVNYRDVCAPVR